MSFPGPNAHNIPLAEAAELTMRFRESSPAPTVIGGLFNGEAIRKLLDQPDCAGLRYYYGKDSNNAPVLVLVGVTIENKDLYEGELLEISVTCPYYCSDENPLNSGS